MAHWQRSSQREQPFTKFLPVDLGYLNRLSFRFGEVYLRLIALQARHWTCTQTWSVALLAQLRNWATFDGIGCCSVISGLEWVLTAFCGRFPRFCLTTHRWRWKWPTATWYLSLTNLFTSWSCKQWMFAQDLRQYPRVLQSWRNCFLDQFANSMWCSLHFTAETFRKYYRWAETAYAICKRAFIARNTTQQILRSNPTSIDALLLRTQVGTPSDAVERLQKISFRFDLFHFGIEQKGFSKSLAREEPQL